MNICLYIFLKIYIAILQNIETIHPLDPCWSFQESSNMDLTDICKK